MRASLSGDSGVDSSKWRVVIVGQTEAWADGAFQQIAGMAEPSNREIRSVSLNDIRAALRSTPRLSWAASYDEIVAVLGNLRTLAWVLEAESRFKPRDIQALASYAAIADHLWRYWTDGKVRFQNLLIRLAERAKRISSTASKSASSTQPTQRPWTSGQRKRRSGSIRAIASNSSTT
jgi:hypothetical protein